MAENEWRPRSKRGAVVREDSKEQIEKCLNCPRARCINCVTRTTIGTPKVKRKGKPVIGYAEGVEVRFDSAHEAGRKMMVSVAAIQQALKKGYKCQGLNWRYENGQDDFA